MGKIYCSECGAELDDSVKFCSSCGNIINDNGSIKQNINNISNTTIMERIEIVPLVIGIFFCVFCQVIAFLLPYQFRGGVVLFGFFIGSFLMGYLSNESYVFVLGYAILTTIISFLIYWIFLSARFFYWTDVLLPLFLTIVFSFIGKFIRIKMKQ